MNFLLMNMMSSRLIQSRRHSHRRMLKIHLKVQCRHVVKPLDVNEMNVSPLLGSLDGETPLTRVGMESSIRSCALLND